MQVRQSEGTPPLAQHLQELRPHRHYDPFKVGDVLCNRCGTFNKNVVTFCNKCGDPVALQLSTT